MYRMQHFSHTLVVQTLETPLSPQKSHRNLYKPRHYVGMQNIWTYMQRLHLTITEVAE